MASQSFQFQHCAKENYFCPKCPWHHPVFWSLSDTRFLPLLQRLRGRQWGLWGVHLEGDREGGVLGLCGKLSGHSHRRRFVKWSLSQSPVYR